MEQQPFIAIPQQVHNPIDETYLCLSYLRLLPQDPLHQVQQLLQELRVLHQTTHQQSLENDPNMNEVCDTLRNMQDIRARICEILLDHNGVLPSFQADCMQQMLAVRRLRVNSEAGARVLQSLRNRYAWSGRALIELEAAGNALNDIIAILDGSAIPYDIV